MIDHEEYSDLRGDYALNPDQTLHEMRCDNLSQWSPDSYRRYNSLYMQLDKIRLHATGILKALDKAPDDKKLDVLTILGRTDEATYHAMLLVLRYENKVAYKYIGIGGEYIGNR